MDGNLDLLQINEHRLTRDIRDRDHSEQCAWRKQHLVLLRIHRQRLNQPAREALPGLDPEQSAVLRKDLCHSFGVGERLERKPAEHFLLLKFEACSTIGDTAPEIGTGVTGKALEGLDQGETGLCVFLAEDGNVFWTHCVVELRGEG